MYPRDEENIQQCMSHFRSIYVVKKCSMFPGVDPEGLTMWGTYYNLVRQHQGYLYKERSLANSEWGRCPLFANTNTFSMLINKHFIGHKIYNIVGV